MNEDGSLNISSQQSDSSKTKKIRMLLKRNVLNQKSTSTLSTSSAVSGDTPPIQGINEDCQQTKPDVGENQTVKRIKRLEQRRRCKRIDISSDSPIKTTPSQMDYARLISDSDSDSDNLGTMTWGSPSKKRHLENATDVANELYSLRVVGKKRQLESDLKQSSASNSNILCHDSNTSTSIAESEISLTQQIHSIQEQSSSCPFTEIPLPPVGSTQKSMPTISFVISPSTSLSNAPKKHDIEKTDCPSLSTPQILTTTNARAAESKSASSSASVTPTLNHPRATLSPSFLQVSTQNSNLLSPTHQTVPSISEHGSSPLLARLPIPQDTSHTIQSSEPSTIALQPSLDITDSLLDASILEEADRIEQEFTQSQVLNDQDLFKVADGKVPLLFLHIELNL